MNIIQKIYQNKNIRNGGLFSIYSFFQNGVSFLILTILTKFLSPSAYGEISLFNTITTFLGIIIGLNTAGYLSISYFANKDINNFKKDFTIIILITVGSALLLCMGIYFFNFSLVNLLNTTPLLLYLALVIATCRILFQILLNYYRIQEKVVQYGIYSCSNSLFTAILIFILIIYYKREWYGYVEGQCLSYAIGSGISLLLFKKWGLYFFKDLTTKRFKNILFWALPLIPHLAAIWIRQGVDRYIIEYNYTTADVGFFSFAINITNVIIMVGTSFNNTFSVNVFKTLSSDISLSQKIEILNIQNKKILTIYIIASIFIVLGAIICVPLFIPEYLPSIRLFLILSLYGLCQCLYFQYCNYFFYFKRTKILMYITFGSSLLHLLLSLIFTHYSLILTCWIYVIIQILIVVTTRHLGIKILKNSVNVQF